MLIFVPRLDMKKGRENTPASFLFSVYIRKFEPIDLLQRDHTHQECKYRRERRSRQAGKPIGLLEKADRTGFQAVHTKHAERGTGQRTDKNAQQRKEYGIRIDILLCVFSGKTVDHHYDEFPLLFRYKHSEKIQDNKKRHKYGKQDIDGCHRQGYT